MCGAALCQKLYHYCSVHFWILNRQAMCNQCFERHITRLDREPTVSEFERGFHD